MATSTDVPIKTYTVSGTSTNSVTFSSLDQNYTNLKIVVNSKTTNLPAIILGRFNSDSSTLYSNTSLGGDGSSITSNRSTNAADMYFSAYAHQSNTWSTYTYHVMDYARTDKYKTTLIRGSNAGYGLDVSTALYRSTNAVTSLTIYLDRAEYWADGTTFNIYGIGSGINGAGGDSTSKASGGEVFSDDNYYYHLFKGSGTFAPTASLTADILVVAGGGGSIGAGGGAGAGGLLGFASQSLAAQPYTITVGAGGVKGYPGSGTPSNGSNSKFGSLTTASGGAYGGGFTGAAYISAGSSGGSGGGAPYNPVGSATTGIAGQGNAGSTGYQAGGGGDPRSGGGGGGAGGAAPNGSANTGGNGGIGATYNSTVGGTAGPYAFINAMGAATGTGQLSSGNYYYAGGGGGEGKNYRGAAGIGGGGQGGTSEPAQYPDAGMANTGGGAGAGPNALSSYGGANGGSGVVIVRYAK